MRVIEISRGRAGFRAGPTAGETVSQELARIARRLRHLVPDHRDPHRFHEEKSEMERQLRRLSRDLEHIARKVS